MRDIRWLVLIPFCWVAYRIFKDRSRAWSRKEWFFTYVLLGSVFFISSVSKFNNFEVNGLDFSVFDWMLHNTVNGRFMWSPFCECNHFGVHPTWLFLTLVPLHAIFSSPWLLVFFHALSLALALPLLKRLMKSIVPFIQDEEIVLFLAAITVSQAFGSIANYGFHPENWYIPLGIWFLITWPKENYSWILPALLFAAVKEDGALYLMAWSVGSWFTKDPRKKSLLMLVGCVVFFLVNTKVFQPMAWPSTQFKPSWTAFWSKYGDSTLGIVGGIAQKPLTAIQDILSSGIWRWFLPFAFLPFFSLQSFFAMLPGILMLGLADSGVLRGYGVYYAAPIVPFAIYGWLILVKRIHQQLNRHKFSQVFILLTVLLGFVGGIGPRLGKERREVARQLAAWQETYIKNTSTETICVQTALYPHLGYMEHLRPLAINPACQNHGLVDSRVDPYPFNDANELIQQAQANGWQDLATMPSTTQGTP